MPSQLKEILKNAKGMIISGTAASSHIDSSGEILDVEGCDISNIDEGVATLNFEHKSDAPSDTVGRIVYGKKIFSEKDCEDDNQLMYWKHSGVPLIYIVGELFDQDDHKGAQDLAAMIRHYADRNLPLLCRFSIEGSTVNRKGNVLKESILRSVAVTCRPCNKDAISGLLFDPTKGKTKDTVKEIAEKFGKFENPNQMKLGGSVEIECNPLLKASEPDFKTKIKDLMKDWDGEGDVKSFIKSKLPEVSDEFLNTFDNALDNFKSKIKRIKKFEALAVKCDLLTKALTNQPEPEEKHVEFGGKKILPGKAEFEGSPVSLLGHDHQSDSVIGIPASKTGGWSDSDIRKIPVSHESLRIRTLPTEVETPPVVDSAAHGVNLTPEAAKMVHGLELDPKKATQAKGPGANKAAYWTKNAEGKTVYVKPDPYPLSFGEAARESAYHNAAKQFFGLGQYLPNVAAVRHPATGHMHTVVEAVPGEHTELDQSWHPDTPNVPNSQEHVNVLHKLGQSGELDKLHLMNKILANPDRHAQNYLFTPDQSIKLIDHGLAFDNAPYNPENADYYQKHANVNSKAGIDINKQPVHPQAANWLMSLDPKILKQTLRRNGVPLAYANESVRRLVTMQEHLNSNPNSSRFDLHNAPFGGVRLA